MSIAGEIKKWAKVFEAAVEPEEAVCGVRFDDGVWGTFGSEVRETSSEACTAKSRLKIEPESIVKTMVPTSFQRHNKYLATVSHV